MALKPLEFLNIVLPQAGWRCCIKIPKAGARISTFHATNQELLDETWRGDAAGIDTYFGTAGFGDRKNDKGRQSRKADNVIAFKSFRFDIDVFKKDRGQLIQLYDSVHAATAAGLSFVTSLTLTPLVVQTGGGAHIYIPLDRDIDPVTWQTIAERLKALATARGLRFDPTVPADAARVLRIPETRNHKHAPPVPVTVSGFYGFNTLASVMQAIGDQANGYTVDRPQDVGTAAPVQPLLQGPPGLFGAALVQPPRGVLDNRAGAGRNDAANLIAKVDHEPSFAEPIAQQCGQLRNMRDSRGNISQPEWFNCLGILAQCADGDRFAHDWSSGHPEYTAEETNRKLAQYRQFSAPYCSTLESVNPPICLACPHHGRIKTPIQLGRNAPAVTPPSDLPHLPYGYAWSPTGQLLAVVHTKEGEDPVPPAVISPIPVYVATMTRMEGNGKAGVLFRLREPTEGWRDAPIALADWEGQRGRSELAEHGVLFGDAAWKMFRNYVHRAVDEIRKQGITMAYTQFGWKPSRAASWDGVEGFLLGDRLITPTGVRPAALAPIDGLAKAAAGLRPRGTLEGFVKAVTPLLTRGNEGYAFALLASLASPFLEMFGDPGGCIFHMHGRTGTGKSLLVTTIGSVWGDVEAFVMKTNDTQVGRWGKLRLACNIGVYYEENHRIPEVAIEDVRNFTTGRDRDRGTMTGGVRESQGHWCTTMISVSNKSLAEDLGIGTLDDAMAMRVFEWAMPTGSFEPGETQTMCDGAKANWGTLADAFLRTIIVPGALPVLRNALMQIKHNLEQELGAGNSHRYLIRLMAAVYLTSQIVETKRLLPIGTARIMAWAKAQYEELAGSILTSDRAAEDLITEFLHSHRQNMLVSSVTEPSISEGKNTVNSQYCVKWPQRDPFIMRWNLDTGLLFINRKYVRDWLRVKKVSQLQEITAELVKAGLLIDTNRRYVLGAKYEIASSQAPCWVVNMRHPKMSGALQVVSDEATSAATFGEQVS